MDLKGKAREVGVELGVAMVRVVGPHPENLLLGSCASVGIAVLLLHQPELHEVEHPMEKDEGF